MGGQGSHPVIILHPLSDDVGEPCLSYALRSCALLTRLVSRERETVFSAKKKGTCTPQSYGAGIVET
jgi:hypothetical protein